MAITPNLPGPSNAYMIYVPVIVFAVVSPLLCGLRLWSRFRKGGRLGADDYVILAALAFSLASSGVMIASCQYGFGEHIANLLPENKIETLKYFYMCQITYKTSINLTKCSILLLYIRLFGNVRWIKWVCWFLVISVGMYCVASVVATVFQCDPVPRAFNKLIPGVCINNATFWYANAGFNIATDVIILLIPMPLVWQLQIPRIQKAALIVVFALGGFVVITSCLRMTTINIAATSPDSTFDISSTMWTMIEMNVAIVCACLPMVRPLLVKLFPSLMPKSSSNARKYGGASGGTGGGGGFGSKGYMSSHSQDREGEWARSEAQDVIRMSSIRKGDQSSEEYILHDAKEAPELQEKGPKGIQKTMQFTVAYE
ncbi:hypothetical protein B0T25DRAFT_176443 [Lasiosphaeria hispida]|uniref:Rhodopsin domain-containing protein n=1 Tax=Lasiosphaeria hispida TaxID=260671 RepID=A0AAJ0HND2_9PEZI|nr:hypothetical protein B0T25DRAFT_176443 [Lasiosphaeria hispida]